MFSAVSRGVSSGETPVEGAACKYADWVYNQRFTFSSLD